MAFLYGSKVFFHGSVDKTTGKISNDRKSDFDDFKYYLAIPKTYDDGEYGDEIWEFKVYEVKVVGKNIDYQGDFREYTFGDVNAYTNNAKTGSYWYVRNDLMKKYKLYKYDEELNLKSIYDVESKEIKTVPINISDKDDNKVMLSINATGNDYKVFISGDNTNWQQVENVTSGMQKELEVNNWSNLYIKIETNTSTINSIEVSYMENQ